MNISELAIQLPAKRRTLADLVRFIGTRTDENPNYNLLLGAGCSVTSGIRSAGELIHLWRQEICSILPGGNEVLSKSIEDQRQFLKINHSDWYDPAKEYSCLFERRYDLQRQRRMFVETEVSKGSPSIGYAYLTSLVSQGFFKNIFTTNFDDLLNEAFYSFSSERPIVCAHDSSINSVTVTSKRPKVIKLHGDYLFDDLKSTLRETESLELNIKAKLVEFSKDAGFVVVGYSGADRSIMDVFATLLKNEDYLRAGVYWCVRTGSDIPEELKRFFWRDRVYFVEVEGFDELFGGLYSGLNRGEVLPASAITTTKRPNDLSQKLIASLSRLKTENPILIKARDKLSRLSKRSAIASQLVNSDGDDLRPAVSGQLQYLTDDELLILTAAQNLVSDGKYSLAIESAKAAISDNPRLSFRKRMLNLQIQAYRYSGDDRSAISAVDELIAMSPDIANYYLLKSRIENNSSKKMVAVRIAVSRDPYSNSAHLALAALLLDRAVGEYGEVHARLLREAICELERCIELDPSAFNPAWKQIFTAIGRHERDKTLKIKRQCDVIDALSKRNPLSHAVLSLRAQMVVESKDEKEARALILDLTAVQAKHGVENSLWASGLELDLLAFCGLPSEILDGHQKLKSLDLVGRDTGVAKSMAVAIRTRIGDEALAERILTENLKEWDFDSEIYEELFYLLVDLGRLDEAGLLMARWAHHVTSGLMYKMKLRLLEAKGEYSAALEIIRDRQKLVENNQQTDEIYTLLCMANYSDAEVISRRMLEPIRFSAEASVEIVNFELARKMQSKKPDVARLDAVRKFTAENATNSAIYCILDKRSEMIGAIKAEFSCDKRFRYVFQRWPVFATLRADKEILTIFG